MFKRDSDNKIVKDSVGDPVVLDHKPQIAVWSSGIRLFDELDEINANYRGLSSRPFKIKRKGEKLDTKYHIAPADVDSGAAEMTDGEKKLAEDKYDLAPTSHPAPTRTFSRIWARVVVMVSVTVRAISRSSRVGERIHSCATAPETQ